MPRGELVEQQPLLFPVGEFGPPDSPEGPAVSCAEGSDDGGDCEFQVAMAGLAWLMVRAYVAAHAVDLAGL